MRDKKGFKAEFKARFKERFKDRTRNPEHTSNSAFYTIGSIFVILIVMLAFFLLMSLLVTLFFNYPVKYLLWVMFRYNLAKISYWTGMLLTFVLMIISSLFSHNAS